MKTMNKRSQSYINPGFLVVGDIRKQGCSHYWMKDRQERKVGDREEANWKTFKKVDSLEEDKAVWTTRFKLVQKLTRLGAHMSGFGYFVPLVQEAALEKLLQEIDEAVQQYDRDAKYTRLDADFCVFRIAANDDRVAVAIYRRAVELLDSLNDAIAKGDVRAIRNLLQRTKTMDTLFPTDTAEKVSVTLQAARKAAKEAVKKAKEMGDRAQGEDKITKEVTRLLKDRVPIDSLRADLVEVADQIGKEARKRPFLAPVDARQIE